MQSIHAVTTMILPGRKRRRTMTRKAEVIQPIWPDAKCETLQRDIQSMVAGVHEDAVARARRRRAM
jgi:hypothetical protein